jgi:hypothetical protein
LAVAIEFVSVIIRKPAVERYFPGGLDGFARQDLANLTEDDHLLRVGFMSTADALAFVSELEAVGLRGSCLADLAVIVGSDSGAPPWLSVGTVNGYAACWDSRHPAGELAWPEPGFLLRCPRSVYDSLSEIMCQCGAELHDATTSLESGVLARQRCVRGEAEMILEVFGGPQDGSPVALWGRRQLERRRQFHADVALIHDLVEVLMRAGADDL